MIEFLYIPLALILYARQYKYHILIDDPVRRDDCPHVVPTDKVPAQTYQKRKSLLAVATNLVVFLACCGYVQLLWGWPAALLFAVFPLNVCGAVWNTGNYYQSTVLLVLTTHYLLTVWGIAGAWVSIFFYWAALNSTPTALSYFPISLFWVYGWYHLVPLSFYLAGKRFKATISGRQGAHANMGITPRVTFETLANVPKVIAYYIWLTLWPSRLAFFHSWGKDRVAYKHPLVLLGSSLICLVWAITLYKINPIMCLWWFAAIGLWSQFIYLGQFIAERYTLLANVAWCVVLGTLLAGHPVAMAVIATLYFSKSWSYAKSYFHNERLFNDSIAAQPEAVENYNNLAYFLLDRGRVVEAIRPLHVALLLAHGQTFGIHTNLANCYIASGEYAKALYHTETALAQAPEDRRHQLINQKFTLVEKIRLISRNKKKLMRDGLIVNVQEPHFKKEDDGQRDLLRH